MIRRLLSLLTGRPLVWLQDHDGEVHLRIAKRTPFGLSARRWSLGVYDCFLREDGSVLGPCYVMRWMPDTSTPEPRA
jgi:hypothetical protein